MTEPRVALLGNVANCLLPMATALRSAGIDADLFVDDDAPLVARPESADPSLAGARWIRRGRWFTGRSALLPWRARVVQELRAYDLVLVSGPGPVYAQWAGRPYLWWVSGHDLTAAPFPWAFRHLYAGRARRLAAYPLAAWQRRGIRRATSIWMQPFRPFAEAAARLRLRPGQVSDTYLPLIVDLPDPPDASTLPPGTTAAIERMRQAGLAVFHPSRLHVSVTEAERRAGQWKGNDRLLEGVAELVRRGHRDVVVVLLETSGNRDVEVVRALIRRLGIEEHVHWAQPSERGGFSRPEMVAMYRSADVVADEFAAGWFGYVTLEGLASGRPVISHLDEAAMRVLYPAGHPVVTCSTPEEVADRLVELSDPDRRAAVGSAGRQWVEEHHSPAAVRARCVDAVTRALADLRVRRSPASAGAPPSPTRSSPRPPGSG